MAGIKNSFGLGGGTSKTRLVADLNDEYKKLNATLKETEKLSKSIAGSLKISGGRAGGADSMSGADNAMRPGGPGGPGGPSGPGNPPAPGGTGGGGNGASYSSALRTMGGAAVTALATGIDTENYIANDVARRRFGFFSGVYSRQNDNVGTIAGAKAFASMSSRGTPTSAMDAANAAMAGNSMGLMSGLKNYNTVINSTAGISNVMPGVGLEGGMGAVAALNQGASVNKLRMIGIQVRDQNGFMRGVEDIARDLWNSLNRNKSGMTKITESDLSFSLQAGNSLAMLLDQYFGTDAVLRQSVVSYLFQFAKNNGAKVGGGYQTEAGKKELLTTGANPGITQSIGARNATGQANINAYTSAGVGGIQAANDLIMNLTKLTTSFMPAFESIVSAATNAQTLGGAGNGAGSILTKGALEAARVPLAASSDLVKLGLTTPEGIAFAGGLLSVIVANRNATQQTDERQADLIQAGLASPNDTYTQSGTNPKNIKADADQKQLYQDISDWYTKTNGGKFVADSKGFANYKMTSTQRGWSESLLERLGAPKTRANVDAIKEWMQHENTSGSNYLGSRNNPLNFLDDPGTGLGLGKDASGAQVYATEAQGLDATAKLLKQGKSQGYQKIVSLLQSGKATEDELWSAISGSKWDEGRYGAGGKMSYNGATININIPNAANMDPTQLASAIKKVLDDQGQVDQARDTTGSGGH